MVKIEDLYFTKSIVKFQIHKIITCVDPCWRLYIICSIIYLINIFDHMIKRTNLLISKIIKFQNVIIIICLSIIIY